MMIKESYISFDISKMLKEAGINILTRPYYRKDGRVDGMSTEAQQTLIKHYGSDDFYPLFTQDSVARWLRDKHGYHIGTNYGFKQKRWWLSASFDSHNKILSLMFFDQGIGIPKSLPRVHPGLFGKIISLFDDDDKKIEAATRAGRTSTNKVYRGKGLPQIINYVKNYEKSGEVKITSGKGVYKMIKKNESKQAEIKLYLNQFDINGTLIEWQIKL